MDQYGTASVTETFLTGRSRSQVKRRSTPGASSSTTQTCHNLRQRQVEIEDSVEFDALLLEHLIQCGRLRHSSGEAVKQKSTATAQTRGTFPHHRDHQVIGDQFSSMHRIQRTLQRGARLTLTL